MHRNERRASCLLIQCQGQGSVDTSPAEMKALQQRRRGTEGGSMPASMFLWGGEGNCLHTGWLRGRLHINVLCDVYTVWRPCVSTSVHRSFSPSVCVYLHVHAPALHAAHGIRQAAGGDAGGGRLLRLRLVQKGAHRLLVGEGGEGGGEGRAMVRGKIDRPKRRPGKRSEGEREREREGERETATTATTFASAAFIPPLSLRHRFASLSLPLNICTSVFDYTADHTRATSERGRD